MAGFFAQENAYLLAIGNACGSGGTSACAPLGNPNYSLYGGNLQSSAEHYPFYDILSGCNSNDITAEYGLTPYCAGPGYDLATGWDRLTCCNWRGASIGPLLPHQQVLSSALPGPRPASGITAIKSFHGLSRTNVTGSDGHTGIAGFTQGWDSIPADPRSEPYQGSGNSFYSGPQYPNATNGCLDFTGASCTSSVSQGCHTANVQAWNNMGVRSSDSTYGSILF